MTITLSPETEVRLKRYAQSRNSTLEVVFEEALQDKLMDAETAFQERLRTLEAEIDRQAQSYPASLSEAGGFRETMYD